MKLFSRFFLCVFALILMPVLAQAADLVDLKSGVMLSTPKELKPFTLYDAQGKNFTNAQLKGQYTLLYFGFTNCPALCPTSMAQLATAYRNLAKENVQPMPQVVFVSVDPERDTAAKVNKFATTFNKNFIGLRTDDMNTLQNMTKDMSVMFTKAAVGGSQDRDPHATYTIDHSGEIIVINPEGKLVALLTLPHDAKSVTEDYKTVVQKK